MSLSTLLVIDLIVATAAALALTVAMRGVTAAPGRDGGASPRRGRKVRRLAAVAFLGFGVFVALTTWLQALLEPAGISDTTAGWLLGAMVVAGVVSSAIFPPLLARRGQERAFLRAAAVAAAAGCLLLAVAPARGDPGRDPARDRAARRAAGAAGADRARTDAASGAAIIWLAGNAGGIVVAVLVQLVNGHPTVAFSLLAVIAASVLAFA